MRLRGRGGEALEALASGILLQGTLLITGIVAARVLGPEARGQLALIWVVVLVLVQLGTLGLPVALTFNVAQKPLSTVAMRRMVRPVMVLQMVLVSGLVLLVLLVVFATKLPLEPSLIAVLVVPAWVLQAYNLATLQGLGAFRELHVLRILPSVAYAVALLTGWALGESTLLFVTAAWVFSYLGSAAITWVVATARTRTLAGEGSEPPPATLPEMTRFGLAGFLGSASPTETFRVDQLIVGLVLTTEDLGLYVTALAFCNLPRFLAQALGLVAYPRIAEQSEPEVQRRLLWRFTGLATVAAAGVAIPLAILAPELVPLAFGDGFSGAVATTQVLLLATVVLCTRRVMSEGLRGVGAPGIGSTAEALSLVALIPALFVCVPPLGVEGVAVALGITYVLSLVVLLVAAERRGLGLRRPASA
ncbi:MAG: lipopolysaccharide biosynthesis protein [Solirubrobacteraceae bacterium]|nr:lipopolysaccharide biosynthesis protein [Solirubrobacteraceae bacterium]